MLFGHFVHLFHYLIHSHLLICRYDLGRSHPPSRTDLPPVLLVQLLCHPFWRSAPCCAQSAVFPCRIPAKVTAVSCISQSESVLIGHAPHFSLPPKGPPPMRFDKLCIIQAPFSPHLPHSVQGAAFEDALPAIPPWGTFVHLMDVAGLV